MSKGKMFLVALAVVGAVAGLVFWFLETHEREEVEVDVPPEPQARFNPHLGLERYFDQLGVELTIADDADESARVEDADLVMLSSEVAPWQQWWDRVADGWMRDGGHLVVLQGGRDDGEAAAERYAELNLTDFRAGDFEIGDEDVYVYDYDWEALAAPAEWRQVVDELGDDFEAPDDDDEDDEIRGPIEPDFVAVDAEDQRPLATSRARGDGRLTVVTDGRVLTNEGLNHGDTGRLIAELMAMDEDWPEEAVAFVEPPGWGWVATLWERAWPVVVGLVVLLGFALTRARRFGPPPVEHDQRQRRRADHVRATGRFLWDRDCPEVLVESSRRALVEQLHRRRPSLQTMDDEEQIEVMADELGITAGELQRLLEGPIPENSAEFQSLIAELERRRRRL